MDNDLMADDVWTVVNSDEVGNPGKDNTLATGTTAFLIRIIHAYGIIREP